MRAIRMNLTAAIVWGAVTWLSSVPAVAATSANAQSPLGMNLTAMAYWSSEQPFLNIFKTQAITPDGGGSGWSTRSASMSETGEEASLQLDASGYLRTLKASSAHPSQQFTQVCALLLYQLGKSNAGSGPAYRPGDYVVLYDGQGRLQYGMDARLVKHAPGRDVFNVANPKDGVWLCITGTDPDGTGNYIRNIRVVKAEEERLLAAGNIFAPAFLNLMSRFRVLRSMQWLNIDSTPAPPGNWANRAQVSDAGWGSRKGVPYEVIVQLCNATGADCWLNVPHTADNNFITQLAALTHASLGATQRVYIEFSNEVWNAGYPQNRYAESQGRALWPATWLTIWPGRRVSGFRYAINWYGMRAAQTCDLWKSSWGKDAARVVCVMGAQAANTWTATEALSCPLWSGAGNAPCSSHGISVVAIAPYFGNFQAQTSWLADADGGLGALFAALTTDIGQVSGWEASYRTALAPYKLPFITYEGGQTLTGFPTFQGHSPVVNLYVTANRDPRMRAAYTSALNNWKANGGQLYVIYADVYAPGMYGEWGALESVFDTVSPLTSAPPKWQAIQNFISNNPCWWAGCSANSAAVRNPLTGVQVTP